MRQMTKVREPHAVTLVRRMKPDHGHRLTVGSVSRSVPNRELPRRRISNAPIPEALQLPPPPREAPATPSPFVVRTPAGSKAGEKERKSTHNPLVILSILITSLKGYGRRVSERGTIQPVVTDRKLPSWATRTGSSTCPPLMARDWKSPRPNLPKKT